MEVPRRDGDVTRAITTVIAERMKTLRTEARLSGPALAAAMKRFGISWNRTTVAKLETGKRESVSVRELLALALVLDVPPILLIADPRSDERVPVAEGVEVSPWEALFWLIGKQRLTGREGAAWNDSALMLEQVLLVVSLVDRFRRLRQDHALDEATNDGWNSDQAAERERAVLTQLAVPLVKLRDWGMPVPPIPEDVRKRATELGVELPGQEDQR